jgi:DNA-binding NarL/FixJ family response regulator
MNGRGANRGPIRVLVVDDNDVFRAGLLWLFATEPDVEVAGQAASGRMALRLVEELAPDIVLMDCRMPDLSGPETTRQILNICPGTRVLVLTISSDNEYVSAALSAGAVGFLTKQTPVDLLLGAVRSVAAGSTWLSPPAADFVFESMRRGDRSMSPDVAAEESLSSRELEVLRLLAGGADNAEVGRALGISPETAKHHVTRIFAKLGVHNRVQAAVYAVRRGVI